MIRSPVQALAFVAVCAANRSSTPARVWTKIASESSSGPTTTGRDEGWVRRWLAALPKHTADRLLWASFHIL